MGCAAACLRQTEDASENVDRVRGQGAGAGAGAKCTSRVQKPWQKMQGLVEGPASVSQAAHSQNWLQCEQHQGAEDRGEGRSAKRRCCVVLVESGTKDGR
jgi:hypothetical protein